MESKFPTMLERPESGQIGASLFYSILAFFSLPFILLLFMQGSFGNEQVTGIVEIVYHVINFLVAVCIYRAYMVESFELVRDDRKGFMRTVSFSAALILFIACVLHALFGYSEGLLSLSAYGTLPLAEMELFTLSSNLILINPIWGTVCMVILAPVTVSCLYYAAVFAPICCKKPWLAYLVMALFIAFPRYCNAATFWDPATEWTLFFTQLPLHLIACWSYQKTDSIWAPILTHMIVNTVSCVLILLTWFRQVL